MAFLAGKGGDSQLAAWVCVALLLQWRTLAALRTAVFDSFLVATRRAKSLWTQSVCLQQVEEDRFAHQYAGHAMKTQLEVT